MTTIGLGETMCRLIPDDSFTLTNVNSGIPASSYDGSTDLVLSITETAFQSDWNELDASKAEFIKNRPSLAMIATSGSYNDLINKPILLQGPQGPIGDTGTQGPQGPI